MLKKTLLGSLLVLVMSNAAASPDSPEDSVQQFYEAATSNRCERAAELRPNFSTDRCEKLTNAEIRRTALLANDGKNAAVALEVSLVSDDKPQDFNGYVQLQKQRGEWVLLDYADVAKITAADFVAQYVRQAPADSPQQASKSLNADVIDENPAVTLDRLRERFPEFAHGNIALVNVSEQRMSIYQGQQKLGDFPISTATKGAGNAAGSDKTPLGAHRISQKFGDNARRGTIFKARQDTGTLADIITEPKDVPTDYVTTRVLWLDGLEPGKNKGGDVDSQSRFIYIHGTPEEGLIGRPASHGCIRMKNDDVIRVYQLLDTDTLVYIAQ